jgi:hypothetical protein
MSLVMRLNPTSIAYVSAHYASFSKNEVAFVLANRKPHAFFILNQQPSNKTKYAFRHKTKRVSTRAHFSAAA